jgi:hypothetical protein
MVVLALNGLDFSFDVNLVFGHFRGVIGPVDVLAWDDPALGVRCLTSQFLLHILGPFLHLCLKMPTRIQLYTCRCYCAGD